MRKKAEGTRSDKVFRIHKNKLEPNIVVKGSIDLDSIKRSHTPPPGNLGHSERKSVWNGSRKPLTVKS